MSLLKTYLLIASVASFLSILIGHLLAAYYLSIYPRLLPREDFTPRVSIVKPVKGLDQGAFENFASFCELNYPSEYEILFCVEDEDDPAIPVIRSVMANHSGVSVRLAMSERPPDWMGKVTNMIKGVQESKYEVLVFSDTDVRVEPDFLTRVVRPLGDPEVGLVFGCPAYREARNLAAAFLAMSLDHFFLGLVPQALVGYRMKGNEFAVGTTMAIRRATLSEIGGLEAFVSKITVDVPLARAVSRHGYRVHLLDAPIPVIHHYHTFTGWWRQLLRYMVMIRHYVPLAYAVGYISYYSIFNAALYSVLSLVTRSNLLFSGVLLFAAIICRIFSLLTINATFAHSRATWWYVLLVPLHDLLRVPLWLLGWISNEVAWRGTRYRILPDDTAVRIPQQGAHHAIERGMQTRGDCPRDAGGEMRDGLS